MGIRLGVLLPLAVLTATTNVSAKEIDHLYDRIASDLAAGRPLITTIYVALCDNDSQGIVKVRNRRICQGDDPDRNLYWAAAGGLASTLRKAGWEQTKIDHFSEGDLAVLAVWRKAVRPNQFWRAMGVSRPFDSYVVGLGYRGSRIRAAMADYLTAVNQDLVRSVDAGTSILAAGGASHLVGYIGHDYFYDVRDPRPLLALRQGGSVLEKGTFALSCSGHRLIRPGIQRPNAHILILNRTLGFPGAWTAEAIVGAIGEGREPRDIYREAAAAFAKGQRVPLGVALASFAYGDDSPASR